MFICNKFKMSMLKKLLNPLTVKNNEVFLTLLMLISFSFSFSQLTINTPTLGGFNQVCASPTFNTYSVSFSFSPVANLQAGNIFTVQLSDASGSFANPTILATSTETTSPVTVSFPFPVSVNGTNYKIRIRSSAPSSTSPSSVSFSANYAVYNQPFTINNNVQNQAVCSSSNFVLSVDSGANSPLVFSELVYKWYRNNIVIAGEILPNLTITQPGNYFAKVDYGTCNLNAYSNVVTVSITQAETLSISSQNNSTHVCPVDGLLLTGEIAGSGYLFQWYKNGEMLSGETNVICNATMAGEYYLIATKNACVFTSNSIILTEDSIDATLDTGTEINLLPGESKILTATTNAVNSTYKWYKDAVLISGETSNTLNITQTGVYKVIVKQNTGCALEKEASTLVSAPTSYSLIIKHDASYVECQNESETVNIDSFEYISSLGTFDVPSAIPLTYKWFKNNIEIAGATNSTYTISNTTENGDYSLEISFIDGQNIFSNSLNVKIKINETIEVSSDGAFLCDTNASVTLTSSITDTVYNYEWFEESSATVLGTNSSYEATLSGNYYVTLSLNGCEISSNLIPVENIDASLMSTNYDEAILIDEGEEITIIASGMDSYQWFINDNLISSTEELTINQEAEVELIGTFGGCEISKIFTINYNPLAFNLVVPNTITPNNDGINDTWILTEEFAYQNDVEVVIFSSNKQVVYQTTNYQNNWPLESIIKRNSIFYYKILKNNSIVQQGTLSVIQ